MISDMTASRPETVSVTDQVAVENKPDFAKIDNAQNLYRQ
jgi:hypothetical protein